ncbi:MAG: glycosyltransferase family 4 protein [Planctomycetaceae bacterium]|nr:glycosyltransferase family 4 protein [Planctomycetaceae bacterium]
MGERLRIGFISYTPIQNRWTSSGVAYSMAQSLSRYCGEVVELGPFPRPAPPLLHRIFWKLERQLTGRSVRWSATRRCCDLAAQMVLQAIERKPCDLLFVALAGWRVATLRHSLPVLVMTDGTLPAMRRMGGYRHVEIMARRSVCQACALEREAMHHFTAIISSSHWAKQSLRHDYDVDEDKIFVIRNAANIEASEVPSLDEVNGKQCSRDCRLLMVGGPWDRKGGDIVWETLLALESLGIQAHLTIVGCQPPVPLVHPRLNIIPFLDKNKPQEARRLFDLYRKADFFILPSRAEAFGIVYAEASAFGLPSVATDVGGVSDAVRPNINGILLPRDAAPGQYAQAIAEIYHDHARYCRLVRDSRQFFDQELNWDAWGRSVAVCMKKMLPPDLAARVGNRLQASDGDDRTCGEGNIDSCSKGVI